jgi:hypothetical protein
MDVGVGSVGKFFTDEGIAVSPFSAVYIVYSLEVGHFAMKAYSLFDSKYTGAGNLNTV